MPRVTLTPHLRRFTGAEGASVEGATVGEALRAFFAVHPSVEGYVVDERGAVRRHVVVFVNGVQVTDRAGLGDPLGPDDEVHVMQALSGG